MCHALLETFDADPPNGRRMLAATFGATAGRSTPIPQRSPQHIQMGTRHTTTYYPLAVCIPEDRADMADAVPARYGLRVTPSLTMRALLDAERAVRTRLEGVGTIKSAVETGRLRDSPGRHLERSTRESGPIRVQSEHGVG
jgi:hypothetical protein